jgi:cytochrome P450
MDRVTGHGDTAPPPFAARKRDGATPATGSTPGPTELISFDEQVDPLLFLRDLIQQYGDTLCYRTRFGPSFVFVHPEDVYSILHNENYPRATLVQMVLGNGLLASDGPYWREQRRLMQPDFLPARLGYLDPIIAREADALMHHWNAAVEAGSDIDLSATMTTLTLRIIVDALFSARLSDADAVALCQAVTTAILYVSQISWITFGMPVRLTPDTVAHFAVADKHTSSFCYELIRRRRALPKEQWPDDLLSLLLRSRQEDGDDRWLRDEMVTMLVGGHETTALALAWAWKELAEHPEVVAALHRELDEVLAGRQPTADDLPRLPYTRGVFLEAMRLYPPVWYMARQAVEPGVINGHEIPAGAVVLVSAWFTHRHPHFWPDPERFDPSRFGHGLSNPRHRYAYFPFGGGRHQCLGMHLALIEGTLILAHLAQRFRVRPTNAHLIKPDPGITLRSTPFIRATVEPRHRAEATR